MSGMFRDIEREGRRIERQIGVRPKRVDVPRLPELEAEVEPIKVIEEEAGAAALRRRKKLGKGGRRSTVLGGIAAELRRRQQRQQFGTGAPLTQKKKLGE